MKDLRPDVFYLHKSQNLHDFRSKTLHKMHLMGLKQKALDGIFFNWAFFNPLSVRFPKMYIRDLRIFFRYFRLLDTPCATCALLSLWT